VKKNSLLRTVFHLFWFSVSMLTFSYFINENECSLPTVLYKYPTVIFTKFHRGYTNMIEIFIYYHN